MYGRRSWINTEASAQAAIAVAFERMTEAVDRCLKGCLQSAFVTSELQRSGVLL